MLSYKVDIGVVGDKLQSLNYEKNVFTNLSTIDIKNVHLDFPKPTNKNRRIKAKGLAKDINKIINWDSLDLPQISIENEEELDEVYKPFELLRQEKSYDICK